MRKWYVPLTVLGVGSLGALLLSERGRNLLGQVRRSLHWAPGKFLEWNETAQLEIERIQAALNRIAESLQPHEGLGH